MAINALSTRGAAGALLAFIALATFSAAPAASAATLARHDSNSPTLMAVPDADPTLMPMPSGEATLLPVPGGAPSPSASAHVEDMSGDGGMAGMDDHSGSASTMPYIATPDAPQRHLVLAGFAAANTLVLGAAAYLRRKGRAGHGKPKAAAAAPARATRKSTVTEGAA